MVMALSGAVIMEVKKGKVYYYCKCNNCQKSEYEIKPYKETEWLDSGIVNLGIYKCPACGKENEINMKFYKHNN